ncbi:MAG: hypothetical protein WBP81_35225 [Solirubrobacteraceae bacterium]
MTRLIARRADVEHKHEHYIASLQMLEQLIPSHLLTRQLRFELEAREPQLSSHVRQVVAIDVSHHFGTRAKGDWIAAAPGTLHHPMHDARPSPWRLNSGVEDCLDPRPPGRRAPWHEPLRATRSLVGTAVRPVAEVA